MAIIEDPKLSKTQGKAIIHQPKRVVKPSSCPELVISWASWDTLPTFQTFQALRYPKDIWMAKCSFWQGGANLIFQAGCDAMTGDMKIFIHLPSALHPPPPWSTST